MKARALKVVSDRPAGRPRAAVPRVQIDKGIPIPVETESIQFPFADMEPGDSFFVACTLDRVSMGSRIRARFRYWRMNQCPRPDTCITIHRVDGGLRCWRLS